MKKIIMIGLLSMIAFGVFAQPRDASNERIEAMKISFITNRLSLTPEQAQKFWPVYNQMTAELKAIRQDQSNITDKPFDELSNAEVEANINAELDKVQSVLDTRRKYIGELKSVISIKQVAKLLMAEEQFKKRLINHMSNRNKPNNRK